MNTILFLIGLFIVMVSAGSYLIIVWNKEKQKIFKQQLEESIKNLVGISNKTINDMQDITKKFIEDNNKRIQQESLNIKLNRDKKINDINKEWIDRLVTETKMKREDAEKLVKENLK